MQSEQLNFLDHTILWAKSESFEMSLVAMAGTMLFLFAGVIWKTALTPVGQALPAPLSVAAAIMLIAGVSGILGHPNKIAQYEMAYQESPTDFVFSEKSRVEKFDAIYKYTIIGAAIAFFAAIVIFAFNSSPTLRAIAVVFVLLGLAGLVIDMFSQERAREYSNAIDLEVLRINEIKNQNR